MLDKKEKKGKPPPSGWKAVKQLSVRVNRITLLLPVSSGIELINFETEVYRLSRLNVLRVEITHLTRYTFVDVQIFTIP